MEEKRRLTKDYKENVRMVDEILCVKDNFDIIKKTLNVGDDELTMYYIDGFVKDAVVSKMIIYLLGLKGFGKSFDGKPESGEYDRPSIEIAENFVNSHVPYVESDFTDDLENMVQMIMSGATLMLGTAFGEYGIIVDARTYPARSTGEPEGDKVMRGARDGFVETLIFNTALIRRRIRNPQLTMSYFSVGGSSKTDIAICYMKDRADLKYVDQLKRKLKNIKTDSLTLGHASLAECLIRKKWYDPFPKIRYTERQKSTSISITARGLIFLYFSYILLGMGVMKIIPTAI